MIHLYSNCYME